MKRTLLITNANSGNANGVDEQAVAHRSGEGTAFNQYANFVTWLWLVFTLSDGLIELLSYRYDKGYVSGT